MGAVPFITTGIGTTAQEAFVAAVDRAHWESGHGGYSGTIAEKDGFVEFSPRTGTASDLVDALQEYTDDWGPSPRLMAIVGKAAADNIFSVYDTKWGPAVAVRTASTEWTFLGTASC